jgi:hypothetical protein
MRRSRVRFGLYAVLGSLIFIPALWLIFGGSRRVTHANFEKIREGMPLTDVYRILGWRNERSNDGDFRLLAPNEESPPYTVVFSEDDGSWLVPGSKVELTVARDGTVIAKQWHRPSLQEAFERMRARIQTGW